MSEGLVWVKESWSLSENMQAEEDGNLETKKCYDDDALLYFVNMDKGWLNSHFVWGFVLKIQSFRKALVGANIN